MIIDVRTHNLDPALWAGDYQEDAAFRAGVQRWVSDLWEIGRASCWERV